MKNLLVTVLLIASGAARADWSGTGEAGLIVSSGNTDTESGNARVAIANELGDWKHSAGLAGLYAKNEDDKTAQRWEVFGESDYALSERDFAFGALRYEDDKFSGFEYQATVSAGLGRHFIQSERTSLTGTAGIGYKFFETRDVLDGAGAVIEPGDSDREVVFRGTADFEHALTETTSLTNALVVESGSSNTFAENALALKVKMNSRLALAVGYTVRHNTDPPNGFTSTDKLTTVNLVYEIK